MSDISGKTFQLAAIHFNWEPSWKLVPASVSSLQNVIIYKYYMMDKAQKPGNPEWKCLHILLVKEQFNLKFHVA